jgi:hypothetical protein
VYFIVSNWSTIVSFFSGIISAIGAFFALVFGYISAPFIAAWNWVVGVWNAAWAFFAGLIAGIGAVFALIFGYVSAPFIAAWNFVVGVLNTIGGAIAGFVGRIAGWLAPVGSFFSAAFGVARDIVSGIIDGIGAVVGRLAGLVRGAVAGIENILAAPFRAGKAVIDGIMGAITGAVHGVESAISFAKGVWNEFAHVWNGIHITVPGIDIPLIGKVGGFTVGLPGLPILAAGGYVTQATLAVIGEGRGGEFVAPEAMLAQLIRDNTGPTYDQLVRIDRATFAEPVDVDLLGKRLAWTLRTAGV